MGYGGFDSTFGMMSIFSTIVVVLVIGVFAYVIIGGLWTWNRNNHSPRLTVDASVAAKRTNVSHHSSGMAGDAGYTSSSSTTYYVTFQVESGDRIELCVSGQEYGMLAEGDFGKLTFQGTRYLGFERTAFR